MMKLKQFVRSNHVFKRFKNTLVIVEHDNQKINPVTLNAITAATKIPQNESLTCLVVGTNCSTVAKETAHIKDVKNVIVSDNILFNGFLAESVAPLVVQIQKKLAFTHIVFGSSAFSKNVMPRVAALLDTQPVSDIIGIKDPSTFVRTIYAGNAIQTIGVKDPIKIFTVRSTAFEPCKLNSASAPANIENVNPENDAKNKNIAFVGQQLAKSDRPSLTGARIVVSGGRGLQNSDNFKMLYELSDKLKAAVGASRAAVDAGYVPNDMQIGQTGKIVAPELYIAVGISGAIQHLAGMKDSKVIAAINKDPEAPIFQVADLGLVDDLFKAVPAMNKLI